MHVQQLVAPVVAPRQVAQRERRAGAPHLADGRPQVHAQRLVGHGEKVERGHAARVSQVGLGLPAKAHDLEVFVDHDGGRGVQRKDRLVGGAIEVEGLAPRRAGGAARRQRHGAGGRLGQRRPDVVGQRGPAAQGPIDALLLVDGLEQPVALAADGLGGA